MDFKKIFKFIVIVVLVIGFIFSVVYYASVTRADENSVTQNDGIESATLNKVLSTIKDLFEKEIFITREDLDLEEDQNLASIRESKKIKIQKEKEKNLLNRKLLDECLARSENEWTELLNHYDDVLNKCVALNIGLNGEKLFKVQDCENQIFPKREEDKKRIQTDKEKCFLEYSKRQ